MCEPQRGLAKKYLRQHATLLLDELELASGSVPEVEGGVPVCRLVLLDGTRGAVRIHQVVVGGSGPKACVSRGIESALCVEQPSARQGANAPAHERKGALPPEPWIEWTCWDTSLGETSGSMRPRPERSRHSMRQKASTPRAMEPAAARVVNLMMDIIEPVFLEFAETESKRGRLGGEREYGGAFFFPLLCSAQFQVVGKGSQVTAWPEVEAG